MKYYISFGKYKKVLIAGNPINACVITLQSYVKLLGDNNPESFPVIFKISQRGFDDHDDDELYSLKEILRVIRDSEKAKKEIAKLNKDEN